MSIASMNAEPMMPKAVVTPWATRVSTKASLGVIRVIADPFAVRGANDRSCATCPLVFHFIRLYNNLVRLLHFKQVQRMHHVDAAKALSLGAAREAGCYDMIG